MKPFRWLSTLCIASLIIVAVSPRPAFSHLSAYTESGGTPAKNKWAVTPVWNLNPSRNANIQGAALADVMQASFATWAAAPGTTVGSVRGPDSSSTSVGFNGENLICFVCTGDFTKEAETLAVTITTTTSQVGVSDGRGGRTQFAGQILDADILFNPSVVFTTDGAANEDLQTVATHEVGHFYGLSHSGVVRAMMFPYSPSNQRTLSYDDVAGIATKYPDGSQASGVISGMVRLGGASVFGAHVFAESQTGAEPWAGANIRKSPISTLSLPDGSYRIEGLPSDAYGVTAEPLDLPMVSGDIANYEKVFGRSVQINFTTRWY